MSDYPKELGSGALFPIEGSDKMYEGNIEIGDTKHRISARRTMTKNGKELFALEVEIGALFVPDQKRGPNSPDMTGKIDISGELMRAAGWHKKAKTSGNSYISLSISEHREQEQAPPSQQVSNDDIPF